MVFTRSVKLAVYENSLKIVRLDCIDTFNKGL